MIEKKYEGTATYRKLWKMPIGPFEFFLFLYMFDPE